MGLLYLELRDLSMQADRYPITVSGERAYEIKPAFTALLESYLKSDRELAEH